MRLRCRMRLSTSSACRMRLPAAALSGGMWLSATAALCGRVRLSATRILSARMRILGSAPRRLMTSGIRL